MSSNGINVLQWFFSIWMHNMYAMIFSKRICRWNSLNMMTMWLLKFNCKRINWTSILIQIKKKSRNVFFHFYCCKMMSFQLFHSLFQQKNKRNEKIEFVRNYIIWLLWKLKKKIVWLFVLLRAGKMRSRKSNYRFAKRKKLSYYGFFREFFCMFSFSFFSFSFCTMRN